MYVSKPVLCSFRLNIYMCWLKHLVVGQSELVIPDIMQLHFLIVGELYEQAPVIQIEACFTNCKLF